MRKACKIDFFKQLISLLLPFKPISCITTVSICILMLHGCSDSVQHYGPSHTNAEKSAFKRCSEPSENSFSFLLAQGWKVSGGITRVNSNIPGDSVSSIEAKLYMILYSPDQKASIGWLPNTIFFDIRYLRGQKPYDRIHPTGGIYKGIKVMQKMTPEEYVTSVAFPFAHPHANAFKVTSVEQLQEISLQYREISALIYGRYPLNNQISIVTMEYSENNIQYTEKMVSAVECWNHPDEGRWSSLGTWYVRAEKASFEDYIPLFAITCNSIKLNPDWLSREFHNMQTNSNPALQDPTEKEHLINNIMEQCSGIHTKITDRMFQNLRWQENYVNPFTGEIERGSAKWSYRWQNQRGDVIYTNNPDYRPNEDNNLQVKGYKSCEKRQRSLLFVSCM